MIFFSSSNHFLILKVTFVMSKKVMLKGIAPRVISTRTPATIGGNFFDNMKFSLKDITIMKL